MVRKTIKKMEKIYEEAQALLLNYLKKFADDKPINKRVCLKWYDDLFEQYVTNILTLERVFIEDGEVLVAFRDNDGDYAEDYARDYSLDDIVEIIKIAEESKSAAALIPTKREGLKLKESHEQD